MISDIYSRRKILIFSGLVLLISNCCLFIDNLFVVSVGLVVQTTGFNVLISILYVYYNEIMSNKLRNKTSGLIFTCWVFGSFSLAFITLFIIDYMDLFYIVAVVSVLCLYILTYFKESPFLLYSKKEYII